MTKFEEKLEKLPIKNIEHPIGDTKYYAAVHVKTLIAQADEEYQELFDKYSNLNDSYEKEVIRSSKLESQIIDLKSQLQQQALPVVPECVGIWIKKCQELNWMITDVLAPEGWSSDFAKDTEKWLKESKENFNLLALAFITGKYQVEKPQLFRLKLKNAPISNYYLWLNQATGKVFVDKKFLDWTNHDNVKNIFTEQEIAKISDGAFVNNEAFELVPVEDGE